MAQINAVILEGLQLLNKSLDGFYRDDLVILLRDLQTLGYKLFVNNLYPPPMQKVVTSRLPPDVMVSFDDIPFQSLGPASFMVSNNINNRILPAYTYEDIFPLKGKIDPTQLIQQLSQLLKVKPTHIYLIGSGYDDTSITAENMTTTSQFINVKPGQATMGGDLAVQHAELNGIGGDINLVFTDAEYTNTDLNYVNVMHRLNYYPSPK
jgi:hypothetical protein